MLEIRNLSVTLGHREVLRAVDVTARPGALTAIVGPNGSGKTTLLRAATGDIDYRGHARLNGTEIAGAAPWRMAAMRAVLAQATTLSFPFTAAEVVRLGQSAGIGAGGPDRSLAALARVGLSGYGGRLYQELSGGEQQRVHLARVLTQVWEPLAHGAPRWLFLDEPVSSLDIGHQLQIMRLARAFADAGGGVVAVMHDLNLTAMFADAVALLAEGRVVAAGAPAEVLTDAHLSKAYGCALRVGVAPMDAPFVLPQAAGARAAE